MVWWVISGGYAVLIGLLAVLPVGPGVSVGHLDKLGHLCEYAIFAWCLRRAATVSASSRLTSLVLALSLSISYGLLLEGAQGWLGYRSAEWGDVIANTVGAILGTWIKQ